MGDPSTAEASSALRHRGGGANTGEDTKDHQSSASSSDNSKALIPPASWTFNKNGVPQCIAHRGYKASFPENTMGAFRGAVEVGAHAIETDLHLSRDGVVVIAHVSLMCCIHTHFLFFSHAHYPSLLNSPLLKSKLPQTS